MKCIKIGYQVYPIETWQPTQATSNEASGEFFSKEKKIGVDGREAGAAKVNTLVHEILHGIMYQYGLELEEKQEEHIVTVLSNGLTQVFVDNGQFVDWIKKHTKNDKKI
tara:strand:+ start:742 stop:1068 length:327 start_codon:yes stop_codon:yes gene_type:complete